jgi:hypothetical protein
MIPMGTIPGMEEWMKGSSGGSEFMYDIFDSL